MRNTSNLKMMIKFLVYVVSKLHNPMQDSIHYKYYGMFILFLYLTVL